MLMLTALLGFLFLFVSCAALSPGQGAAPVAAPSAESNTAPSVTTSAVPSAPDGGGGDAGLTAEEEIDRIMDSMTTEQKCGQLFFIRCPESEAATTIGRIQPGGIVLFAQHFNNKTAAEIQDAIAGYQSSVLIPMLVAADEEGGTVNRISLYKQLRAVPFLAPQALYREGGLDLIRSDTQEKAELLIKLGLNVNLAPVCDVSTD